MIVWIYRISQNSIQVATTRLSIALLLNICCWLIVPLEYRHFANIVSTFDLWHFHVASPRLHRIFHHHTSSFLYIIYSLHSANHHWRHSKDQNSLICGKLVFLRLNKTDIFENKPCSRQKQFSIQYLNTRDGIVLVYVS